MIMTIVEVVVVKAMEMIMTTLLLLLQILLQVETMVKYYKLYLVILPYAQGSLQLVAGGQAILAVLTDAMIVPLIKTVLTVQEIVIAHGVDNV